MLLNQLLTKLRMRLAAALVLFGGFMLLGHGTLSQAQSWPDKPIKLIIPFAPGGTTDILGRALAQQLTIVLKQNVIIENRAGAGGNIGAEAAAKAPARQESPSPYQLGRQRPAPCRGPSAPSRRRASP